MTMQKEQGFGHLAVEVESESIYFGYNVPIDIRDSRLRLVKQTETQRQFELRPGLYEVSAVLEDGQQHSELVEIRSGERSAIVLDAGVGQRKPDNVSSIEWTFRQSKFNEPRFTQTVESMYAERDDSKLNQIPGIELVEATGATNTGESPGLWSFEGNSQIDAVPTATLRLNEREVTISLPITPRDVTYRNSCAVRVDTKPGGFEVRAWISRERTIANAFMNMLASGQMRQAAHMAGHADSLLRDKYQDPTGAALGGIILHKVGNLGERVAWVENLARDFAWMPDGKVLLASVLVEKRETLDVARQLALEASAQRMLYTDSYSILLDLLRRWPTKHESETHRDAVTKLAARSPYIDWNSMCLSETSEA